jgi:tetratricopeptide (TPR) repeat protein
MWVCLRRRRKEVERAAAPPPAVPRFHRPALAIFALALLVRLLVAWRIGGLPISRTPHFDSLEYLQWARALADGQAAWPVPPAHGPGYPFFLALFLWIGGGSLVRPNAAPRRGHDRGDAPRHRAGDDRQLADRPRVHPRAGLRRHEFVESGDLARAAASYARAAELDPRNRDALVSAAQLAGATGSPGRGLDFARRALALHEDGETWALLAVLAADAQQPAAADEALRRALALIGNTPELQFTTALVRHKQHRYAEADRILRALLAQDPDMANARALDAVNRRFVE